jgi:glucose 1-dehydrogenase
MRLEGKSAIVTGAARGIGLAVAKRYVAEGAAVSLIDVNEEDGAAEAATLNTGGGRARFAACDVGDKAAVDAMTADHVEAFGGLDILVNNAAIIHGAEFLDLAEEDFDRVLRVNLKGALLCSQAAGRVMAEQGSGVMVNMSSVNAVVAIPDHAPYVVAKGGLAQLTKVAALALASKGIRVNAIGPGTILTELAKTVMNDEAARRKILARTPMGRLGDVDEVAAIAVFLASDDASYVTGETIYCDGGRLALNYTVPVDD